MTTFLINSTNQIFEDIDNATIWDLLQHHQSLGVILPLDIGKFPKDQRYRATPTMTLRDRRADKKNALTLACLFNLHNIKSTFEQLRT